MKKYVGNRYEEPKVTVKKEDKSYRLPPRNDLMDHSPDGFEWGYGGSGPSQLAFAILYDYLEEDFIKTVALYQEFKWEFIAPINEDSFTIAEEDIDEWMNQS